LYGRINYEEKPPARRGRHSLKLQRMQELMERLGEPGLAIPTVHVAGTKGKGSTAAMIAAILQAAGYRTGLFTSPHLERIEERFSVDGANAEASEFVDLAEAVRPVVDALDALCAEKGLIGPTFFEICTALALVHFQRHKVDAMVLEVGLGGRLDSTNICRPVVCVITSISYDHTKQLGNTLAEIAREKAGIIKPGVPVVSGVIDPEPRRVIEQIAAERGSRLLQLGRDFDYRYHAAAQDVDLTVECETFDYLSGAETTGVSTTRLPLTLLGEHQAANAAVAVATIEELVRQGWSIEPDAVRQGLAGVRLPARTDVVRQRPTVILDTAHNVASIQALVNVIQTHFSNGRRHLVFAATQDKDVRGMLDAILPHFDTMRLTQYTTNPRGVPLDELARLVEHCVSKLDPNASPIVTQHGTPDAAWHFACAAAEPDDLICITGSFFLAAELRQVVAGGSTNAQALCRG
jgi:dihydrofolate synthase/folylpolyglutamate synthase